MDKRGTCSRRDLVEEGLGQNKALCSFLGLELPMVNYHAGFPALAAPKRQISSYLPAFGSRIALTWILPCYLFLVASLGALYSTSCRSPSFPLRGKLDCWLGHRQSGVQGCWYRCRLLRMVLIKGADHLPEVYDCRGRFPSILFF